MMLAEWWVIGGLFAMLVSWVEWKSRRDAHRVRELEREMKQLAENVRQQAEEDGASVDEQRRLVNTIEGAILPPHPLPRASVIPIRRGKPKKS